MNLFSLSFLRNKPMFYCLICILFSVSIFSCSDENISLKRAKAAIESGNETSPVKRFNKNQGKVLYAYSTISLSVPDGLSKVQTKDDVSYRVDIDNITVSINDTPIKVNYEIEKGNIISVYPDEYFPKSGKLLLTIHFQWKYWGKSDTPYSSDISEWTDYKKENISIEYDVFARVVPLNIFEADNIQSINTNIYHIPLTAVAYLPNNIIENKYKYELESSLEGIKLSPSVEENNMIIYYEYEGELQSQKNYTFTVKAKWHRLINNSWVKCADIFDETFTQTIVTSESSNTKWGEEVISFFYPMYRQFNFLPEEYSKGYIKLSDKNVLRQYTLRTPYVEIIDVKTQWKMQSEVSFNKNLEILEYDLPQNNFEPDKIYEVAFRDRSTDAILYSYHFKTSKFKNFTEKWTSLLTSFKAKWRDPVIDEDGYYGGMVNYHLQKINIQNLEERFDDYEIAESQYVGFPSTKRPLIQFNSHIPVGWDNTFNWYVYSQPSITFDRKSAAIQKYSYPPTDAIYFVVFGNSLSALSDNSCITGDVVFPTDRYAVFVWAVKAVSDLDVRSAVAHARRIPETERTEAQKTVANQTLPMFNIDMALGGDQYPLFDVYYVLPGLGIKTTTIKNVQL